MTDRCRWVSSDQPRVLPNRHHDGCEDETCRGCQPCPMDHCRVCGIEHASGACPDCLGATRDDLDEIRRMCDALPEEAEVSGVNGEATMMLGPAADPEAWGHREASARAGRIPADYLEVARDETHPLWVLASWAMVYRDAFEHDEPTTRVDVLTEGGYLERNLGFMGDFEYVPFEDFARDLRRCVSHMEAVLHDGEQVDLGVQCLKCGKRLKRVWGIGGAEDGWRCERCQQWSNDKQYQLALKRDYIKRAEWLTDVDMAVRVPGVTAATVRSWAATKGDRPVLIRKKLHTQRTVYSVEDVQWIYACTQDTTDAA